MTEYDVTLSDALMPEVLERADGLAKIVESVLNQVLEAQVREHLGVGRYERSEERTGLRNGYRERQLSTGVGAITLRVPQTRDGSFSTEIFARYRRSEQAFVVGLMEMVVHGVSTRKVTEMTEGLCGASFSKSTVSRLTKDLDESVRRFLERRLDASYPFIIVDAISIKIREDARVRSKAVLIANGIRSDGIREILGLAIGDAESHATWSEFFSGLKKRGLHGVDYVTSDSHAGLIEAIRRQFVGATWQRCQVHLMRNVLSASSSKMRAAIGASPKKIFSAIDAGDARRRFDEFVAEFAETAKKAIACLENGIDDALAVLALPERYRRRLRATNMAERLNEEIRRRERVIRIFPNEASTTRLIGALLAEMNETWLERRYLDMDEYHEWNAETKTRALPSAA